MLMLMLMLMSMSSSLVLAFGAGFMSHDVPHVPVLVDVVGCLTLGSGISKGCAVCGTDCCNWHSRRERKAGSPSFCGYAAARCVFLCERLGRGWSAFLDRLSCLNFCTFSPRCRMIFYMCCDMIRLFFFFPSSEQKSQELMKVMEQLSAAEKRATEEEKRTAEAAKEAGVLKARYRCA